MPKCTASTGTAHFRVCCIVESPRSAAASSGASRLPSSAVKPVLQSTSSHTSGRSRGRLHRHATWSTNTTQGDCSSRPSWKPDVPRYIASRPLVLVPPLKAVMQSFPAQCPSWSREQFTGGLPSIYIHTCIAALPHNIVCKPSTCSTV